MAILRGQRSSNDCGPTCFANALNILGYDIKISQANELCSLTKDGTDSTDLTNAFDRYGFECKDKTYRSKKRAWDWLIKDTNKGLPVIIGVDADTHWVLVLRASKQEAQILDPNDGGPIKITQKKLLDRWGFCKENIIKPVFQGIKLIPYKDKSIRATLLREKLLATVDIK